MVRRRHKQRYEHIRGRRRGKEEHLRLIKSTVSSLWERDESRSGIADVVTESNYIERMRQRYKFPDYLSIVGEPSEDDFNAEGELKLRRKAELMLIGIFDWQGFKISRPVSYSTCCGLLNDWLGYDEGWYVALEPVPQELKFETFFFPLNGVRKQKLERHLVAQARELKNAQKVSFKDGNAFDCHPDNLEIRGQGGRPMLCVHCRNRTTKEMSVRIKVQGVYDRYCRECIQKIADWKLGDEYET